MNTPSSDHRHDELIDAFRASRRAKATVPVQPLATPAYRRRAGLLLGLLVAVMYGLVSQGVNRLALPGVPFVQPPADLVGNLLLILVSGAAIGLVCAAPEHSSDGVVRASAAAVLAVVVQWLTANPPTSVNSLLTLSNLFGLGLLYIGAFPAMMLLRLAVDNQTEALDKPIWAWGRLRAPLSVLALVAVAGAFSIFPDHIRAGFSDLHALIRAGLSVHDPAGLPPALRAENGVSSFLDFASADYTLEQSSDFELWSDLSLEDEVGNAILMARFPRGGIVACAYSLAGTRLRCRSYFTAAFFQRTG